MALELRVNPRFWTNRMAHNYASAGQQDSPSFVEYPLPIVATAQDLDQQYQVEEPSSEWQLSTIGVYQHAIVEFAGNCRNMAREVSTPT